MKQLKPKHTTQLVTNSSQARQKSKDIDSRRIQVDLTQIRTSSLIKLEIYLKKPSLISL